MTPSFLTLSRKFPLRPIASDEELELALEVIEALMRNELDEGEEQYLETLSLLTSQYEREHHSIPDTTESEVLEHLMAAGGLSQSQLARETGIAQSTISAVLAGERELTKEHVLALAPFFHVQPAVFLPCTV